MAQLPGGELEEGLSVPLPLLRGALELAHDLLGGPGFGLCLGTHALTELYR